MRRASVAAGAALAALLLVSVTAAAGPAAVSFDSGSVSLSKSGDWTGSVGVHNLTTSTVTLTATGAADADCGVSFTPPAIRPAQHSTVTVTVSGRCSIPDAGLRFTVRAAPTGGGATTTVDLTATGTASAAPDWGALNAFGWAMLAGLAGAAALLLVRGLGPLTALPGLDQTWSFGDSWVSSATGIGGLLAGIFGSSGVVATLGVDAGSATKLATVGGIVSAACVALAPIVLTLSRTADRHISAGGVLLASVFVVTGAGGGLYVVWDAAKALDLGGAQDFLWIALAVALALLAVYAVRTALATLDDGRSTTPPPPEPVIVAARMIVAALRRDDDIDVDHTMASLRGLTLSDVTLGEVRRRPRRTAML